jgi:16S rRNA (cytidine1402-2'-O)-methyltransferase
VSGSLYLVPTLLGEAAGTGDSLPPAVVARVHALDDFVVENARSARRFLSACGYPRPLQGVRMALLDEHTAAGEVEAMLAPLAAGRDLGLLSEAGAPAVADPGARLVEHAHRAGHRVVPLVGPSSLLLALMASGLEGQRFRFLGYLPASAAERGQAIAELEGASRARDETQVFIETPYRGDALLADLVRLCRPDTRLAVAADLTLPTEAIRSEAVSSWRARPAPVGKRPAVFLLLAAKAAKAAKRG